MIQIFSTVMSIVALIINVIVFLRIRKTGLKMKADYIAEHGKLPDWW